MSVEVPGTARPSILSPVQNCQIRQKRHTYFNTDRVEAFLVKIKMIMMSERFQLDSRDWFGQILCARRLWDCIALNLPYEDPRILNFLLFEKKW